MKIKTETFVFALFPSIFLGILLCGCSASQEQVPAETMPPEPSELVICSDNGEKLPVAADCSTIELPDSGYVSSFIAEYPNFTSLTELRFPDGVVFTAADVRAIKEAAPALEVKYNVSIKGKQISLETDRISLEDISCGEMDFDELCRELAKLPRLQTLSLNPADGNAETEAEYLSESQTGLVSPGLLSFEEIRALQDKLPELELEYSFYLYGQGVSLSDESLEYVKTVIGDEGLDNFRLVMPCMKKLTYLKLDTCETTSSCMGLLREEFPQVKIAWRIWFSHYGQCGDGKWDRYNTLTDTEKIWATGTVYDEDTEDLKYCTDVRYLDLGHNAGLTKVEFINYMPKLEVAVLSITYIDDISPLANCSELEFLELFRTYVSDLSPLENCTKLQHLYVYDEYRKGITDISPILKLTNLKRFYCTVAGDAVEQSKQFREMYPDCETDFSWVFIGYTNWRTDWRTGEYAERYVLLREQFGYDTFDMSK